MKVDQPEMVSSENCLRGWNALAVLSIILPNILLQSSDIGYRTKWVRIPTQRVINTTSTVASVSRRHPKKVTLCNNRTQSFGVYHGSGAAKLNRKN